MFRVERMGEALVACDIQSALIPAGDPISPDKQANENLTLAWVVLPQEILEVVWEQIPHNVRALLSKSLYHEWRQEQMKNWARGRRGGLDLTHLLRRQIRLSHTYTFGVMLDIRGQVWNKRRPWKTAEGKYTSYLWYLESVCAQLDKHEMRGLVRDAIHRYEGSTRHRKTKMRDDQQCRDVDIWESKGHRRYQKARNQRDWVSFG